MHVASIIYTEYCNKELSEAGNAVQKNTLHCDGLLTNEEQCSKRCCVHSTRSCVLVLFLFIGVTVLAFSVGMLAHTTVTILLTYQLLHYLVLLNYLVC